MHRRKSFLFRLFALLFALLLLITASVELALYHYARQVVGQEYILPARWWGRSTSASTRRACGRSATPLARA